MEYFEVPLSGFDVFLCSDDECPCTDQKRLTPGVDGFLYISPDLVEMRRDCISWSSAQVKLTNIYTNAFGSNFMGMVSNGVINPVFLCETGAKKRNLDLTASAKDAKYWAENGWVPLRPSPVKKPQDQKNTGCLVSLAVLLTILLTSVLLMAAQIAHAQKSESRNKGFSFGLSYRVYEFYAEDYAVSPNLLTNGNWADGLLGFDFGYQLGVNKLIGLSADYRFLVGAFNRGFDFHNSGTSIPDFAMGHQVFAGPVLNLGKSNFNISFKTQVGYDFLKVNGQDSKTYSVTARSNIVYVGNAPGWWLNWLNNHDKTKQVEISYDGYPAYKRRGFLYQIGTHLNYSKEKTTFSLYGNYCPAKYSGIKHEEFDIGIGTVFHF